MMQISKRFQIKSELRWSSNSHLSILPQASHVIAYMYIYILDAQVQMRALALHNNRVRENPHKGVRNRKIIQWLLKVYAS